MVLHHSGHIQGEQSMKTKTNVYYKGVFFLLFVGILQGQHQSTGEDTGNTLYIDELDSLVDSMGDWRPAPQDDECLDAQGVLNIIADPTGIDIQAKLQENVYIVTHPLNQRSLLDLPAFLIHEYCLPSGWQCNGWGFYNETHRMVLNNDGTNISSYLNIFNANLVEDIESIFRIDIPTAQELIGVFRVEERRAGIMAGFYRMKNRWNIECKTPLYYLERNFFATPQERMRIQAFFNISKKEREEEFISDQVGFGDTRVTLGYFAIQRPTLQLNVGAEATVPTAVSFGKGLYGTNFKKNNAHAPFDILYTAQLLCPPTSDVQQALNIVEAFLVSAYNKLAANLLQPEMGNEGHWGLILFAEKYMQLNERFKITTRGAFEYVLPAQEKRFFITKKFPQEFAALEPYTSPPGDPALAPAKLAFLNQQLIDTLIPKIYKTTIYPGFIVKIQSSISGKFGRSWGLGAGIDVWWQDRERLGKVHTSSAQVANIQLDLVRKQGAFQQKFFASARYVRTGKYFPWCLTAYGDYTFLNSGIGKDFNVMIRLAIDL